MDLLQVGSRFLFLPILEILILYPFLSIRTGCGCDTEVERTSWGMLLVIPGQSVAAFLRSAADLLFANLGVTFTAGPVFLPSFSLEN